MLVRKHRSCAAKAGGNFIDHQMHLIAVAQRTHLLQVTGIVHGHAGGTLHHRFDNQRRGAGVVLLQPDLQRSSRPRGNVGGAFTRLR